MQIPDHFIITTAREDSSFPLINTSELSKYALVGVMGTSTHYTIMAILHSIFSVGLILSSTSGAIAGALVNYLLNYFYTFQSKKNHECAAINFWLVSVFGWNINASILMLNENIFNINIISAQLLATLVVFVITYFMNQRWTFK